MSMLVDALAKSVDGLSGVTPVGDAATQIYVAILESGMDFEEEDLVRLRNHALESARLFYAVAVGD